MDDKSLTETAHTHTHTHTYVQTHAHKVIMWHPPWGTCDTYANETGPASSRQHSVIRHSSTSLQKLKSFSPPSPVIVAIIFSPTQSGGLRNLSPYVFLFVFPWGYCICHLTHAMKENSSARSLSSYLIQMGEVIRQSLTRLLVAGSSWWYKPCTFQVIVSTIKNLQAINK